MLQRFTLGLSIVAAFAAANADAPRARGADESVDCGCGCGVAAPGGWFTADYLQWWLQGDRTPALVTSNPAGTALEDVGNLAAPSTSVLFGDDRTGDAGRPGVRLGGGKWLGDGCDLALGGEIFWVGEDAENFSRLSDGNPALARPFFNTDPDINAPDAELIAFDDPSDGDIVDGRVSVQTGSDIYSANLDLHKLLAMNLQGAYGYRVESLAGYRFFRLDESLQITENLLVTGGGGAIANGTTIDVLDQFGASNEFHGFELGAKGRFYRGLWALDALGKLGLGNNHQRVRINGSTTVTVPTFDPLVTSGGLLAQDSNIGVFEHDSFALLPELQLNLIRHLNDNWDFRVGYTLLFLTDVVRPGSSIDTSVNGLFLNPNAPPFNGVSPAFALHESSVWLQGINFGLACQF